MLEVGSGMLDRLLGRLPCQRRLYPSCWESGMTSVCSINPGCPWHSHLLHARRNYLVSLQQLTAASLISLVPGQTSAVIQAILN